MKMKKSVFSKTSLLSQLLPLLLCIIIIGAVVFTVSSLSESNEKLALETIRTSVTQSIITCYAAEGVYPNDVSYLEEHYGLLLNHDDYAVFLNSFASNIMPTVAVIAKN